MILDISLHFAWFIMLYLCTFVVTLVAEFGIAKWTDEARDSLGTMAGVAFVMTLIVYLGGWLAEYTLAPAFEYLINSILL